MKKKSWIWIGTIILITGLCAGIYFYRQMHDTEKLCLYARQMEVQGQFSKALDYYLSAEKQILAKPYDHEVLASLYMKIGRICFITKKYDAARLNYNKAGKIWKQNDSPKIIQVYSNFATIYLEENNFMLARDYYLMAVKKAEIGETSQLIGMSDLAQMYYYLADVSFELNILTEAEIYYLKSLNVLNKLSNVSKLKEKIYWRLAVLCHHQRKYAKALTYGLMASLVKGDDWPPSQWEENFLNFLHILQAEAGRKEGN